MKNKKLLLKSMMVLSLIFAISCNSNSNPNDTTTKQDPVAIDLSKATSKDAKTTDLKMVVGSSSTTTKAEVTFTGADADATLTVTGLGLVATDPSNSTGTAGSKAWEKLLTSDLSKDDIELSKSGGNYTVAIKNAKANAINSKLTGKYSVIGVQVKATKAGKEDKDLTFYVVVRAEA